MKAVSVRQSSHVLRLLTIRVREAGGCLDKRGTQQVAEPGIRLPSRYKHPDSDLLTSCPYEDMLRSAASVIHQRGGSTMGTTYDDRFRATGSKPGYQECNFSARGKGYLGF